MVPDPWSFFARGAKDTRETLADEPGDVVAVEVVVRDFVKVDAGADYGLLSGSLTLWCHYIQSHSSYTPERVNAFVYDLCFPGTPSLSDIVCSRKQVNEESPPTDIGPPTLISMVFVLSAIPPALHEQVMRSMVDCLQAAHAYLCVARVSTRSLPSRVVLIQVAVDSASFLVYDLLTTHPGG